MVVLSASSNSINICAAGDSSFVGQCFAYLAACDLIFYCIAAGILILLWLLFDFIVKLKED